MSAVRNIFDGMELYNLHARPSEEDAKALVQRYKESRARIAEFREFFLLTHPVRRKNASTTEKC